MLFTYLLKHIDTMLSVVIAGGVDQYGYSNIDLVELVDTKMKCKIEITEYIHRRRYHSPICAALSIACPKSIAPPDLK